MKMIEVPHNTHRVKDGAYMENPKQQIGSFIKYLSDAVKGHAKPELSPIEYGSEFKSIFNGFIKVACINRKENTYRVSWKYMAGRGGIAEGTKDVARVVTITVADGVDLEDYLANILDNPQSIFVSV